MTWIVLITIVCATVRAIDFGIAVIPDTQYYSGWHPETFEEQCHWICACSKSKTILFASHLGDVVHNGNNDPHQWKVARSAMFRLENCGVPHAVLPGNHDVGIYEAEPYKLFDHTFPVSRYSDKSWFGGSFPPNTMHNNYQLFERDDEKFLFLHLEYLPSLHGENITNLMAWADTILDQHADRTAFISSHLAGNACVDFVYPLISSLMNRHCNVLMAFGGHVIGCSGERVSPVRNKCGQTRHVIISNFQKRKKGGDGWLRHYRFRDFSSTDNTFSGTLCAFTYSPQLRENERDSDSFFSIDISNGKMDKGCQILPSESCDVPFVSEGFVLGTLWIVSVNLLSIMFVFGIPLSYEEWFDLLDHQTPVNKNKK